jgi:hypothetical protein
VIGLALLALGAVALWAAFTGRAEAVLTALKMDLPTIGAGNAIVSGNTGSDGSSSSGGSSSAGDIGSHSALTDGGLTYIISKSYADMTQNEKHDANNFAHQQTNLGSTG